MELDITNLILPAKLRFVGRRDSLDALHAAANRLAIKEQDRRGTCATYWCFVHADSNKEPLVLETRWANNFEKQLIVGALRGMLKKSPEIVRYCFVGEGYGVAISPVPEGTSLHDIRDGLPKNLKDHPAHYEILMVFAFERGGKSKALVYNFPTGRPQERVTDERAGEYAGQMWDLFDEPKPY